MKLYETTSILLLSNGKVGLNPRQAHRRQSALENTRKEGVYKIISPIEFKVGEIIGFVKPAKSLLQKMSLVEEDKK